MKRESITGLLVLAGIIAAGILVMCISGGMPDAPSSGPGGQARRPPDTARYVDLVLHPDTAAIGMYWRDEEGRNIRSLEALRGYIERSGKRLRFATNGGMYREDRSPAGLFIQNGRPLSRLNTADGPGNFHLKPNGVFLLRNDGSADVVTTEEFRDTGSITFATQSGPMLLIGGATHPKFRQDSEWLNIRNGVGVRPDGAVVFSISQIPVTFHEFAAHFREMGCTDALYLDGFVSRCYLPEKGLAQLDGDFGVMIGVAE